MILLPKSGTAFKPEYKEQNRFITFNTMISSWLCFILKQYDTYNTQICHDNRVK